MRYLRAKGCRTGSRALRGPESSPRAIRSVKTTRHLPKRVDTVRALLACFAPRVYSARAMDLAAVLALEVLNGIASLVLISVGLAIIFGMMRVINLAHGEFLMLGGYAAIVATNHGVNIWIAMLVVAPIVVGHHRRHRRAPDHPRPVRPHDRHAARHLGPEPVLRRPGDDDLRQHGGRHRRAARQRRGRALQHQPVPPGAGRHRGGDPGDRSTSCCARRGSACSRAARWRTPTWPPRSA